LETAALPIELLACKNRRKRLRNLSLRWLFPLDPSRRLAPLPSLRFPVNRVLPLMTAELLELDLFRHGLLVLRGRVIAVLALGALEGDDFASCPGHLVSPLTIVLPGALDEI
jgi:hypothetical protein